MTKPTRPNSTRTGLLRRSSRQEELLRCVAREGSIFKGAVVAGVARRTLYDWRGRSPEFEAALTEVLCEVAQKKVAETHASQVAYSRSRKKSRWIAPAMRVQIMERDAYRCRYCGGYRGGLQLDHVVPFAAGGLTAFDNLVTACTPCNSNKQDRTPEEAGMPLLPVPT